MHDWMRAGVWLPEAVEGDVSREIHRRWFARRVASGWRLGAPDIRDRTSPYLKPLDAFTAQERLRETWLCRGDLLAIKSALCAESIDPDPSLLHSELQARQDDRAFHLKVATIAHDHWRAINDHLGRNADQSDDIRLATPYEYMNAQDQALTLDNVAVDLEALAYVVHARFRRVGVHWPSGEGMTDAS